MHEFDLLRDIYKANDALPRHVQIGPGDDMAMLSWADDRLLVAADPLIDGVHVDLTRHSLEQVAHKAIARNVSDVAAMAGQPVATLACAMLPRSFDTNRAGALFDAMRKAAAHMGCPLIGGDIAVHTGAMTLAVTILAKPDGIEPITRRGAQAGDKIYVTGELGNSCTSGHHLAFIPRVELARQLAASPATRPVAMIDLSDGLARDLSHLADHAIVQASALPMRAGTRHWQQAVGEGEDYELLIVARGDMPDKMQGVAITCIGRIESSGGLRIALDDGAMHSLDGLGWEHRS